MPGARPASTVTSRLTSFALLAAAFLAAGAVVSVGVAVGFGLWGTVRSLERGSALVEGGAISSTRVFTSLSSKVNLSGHRWVLGLLPEEGLLHQWRHRGWGTEVAILTIVPIPNGDQDMAGGNASLSDALKKIQIHQTGWPMRAFEYRHVGEDMDADLWPDSPSGWRSPAWLCRSRYFPSVFSRNPRPPLPLRPIPFGLAVNALFFGAVLFAPYGILGLGRRLLQSRRNRLRNLCPSCGYSREGLGMDQACPECGNP